MLAIVIPYFKIAFFEDTLESLSKQTNKKFTVYIGNDFSPEPPDYLIEKYNSDLPIVYHKFSENLGAESLVKHWDRCIDLTKNEKWILILGDDDVLEKNCVEDFYKHEGKISQQKINLGRFASVLIDADNNQTSKVYTHPEIEKSTTAYIKKHKGISRGSLSEHIFLKDAYTQKGFFDFKLAWHADDYAFLEFTNYNNIYTINSSKVLIRVSNLSVSGNSKTDSIKHHTSYLFFKKLIDEKINYFSFSEKVVLFKEYKRRLKHQKILTFKNRVWVESKIVTNQIKALFN